MEVETSQPLPSTTTNNKPKHSKKSSKSKNRLKEYYIVEKILDRKIVDDQKLYLIKWQRWPESQSTWEPAENLLNVLNMVVDYEVRMSLKEKHQDYQVEDPYYDNPMKHAKRRAHHELSAEKDPMKKIKQEDGAEIILDNDGDKSGFQGMSKNTLSRRRRIMKNLRTLQCYEVNKIDHHTIKAIKINMSKPFGVEKMKVKAKDIMFVQLEDFEEKEEHLGTGTGYTSVLKKRGRPRIHPLKPINLIKRTRGRPRKVVDESVEKPHTPKKRGRPKKIVESLESIGEVKVIRPKIVNGEVEVKRKRGRPRKDEQGKKNIEEKKSIEEENKSADKENKEEKEESGGSEGDESEDSDVLDERREEKKPASKDVENESKGTPKVKGILDESDDEEEVVSQIKPRVEDGVKRGRGRPRKYPLENKNGEESGKSGEKEKINNTEEKSGESEDNNNSEENREELLEGKYIVKVVKRGRGRPRKDPLEKKNDEENDKNGGKENNNESEESKKDDENETENKPGIKHVKSDQEKKNGFSQLIKARKLALMKRRGLPFKVPSNEEKDKADDSSPVKRKRGRPRKIKEDQMETEEEEIIKEIRLCIERTMTKKPLTSHEDRTNEGVMFEEDDDIQIAQVEIESMDEIENSHDNKTNALEEKIKDIPIEISSENSVSQGKKRDSPLKSPTISPIKSDINKESIFSKKLITPSDRKRGRPRKIIEESDKENIDRNVIVDESKENIGVSAEKDKVWSVSLVKEVIALSSDSQEENMDDLKDQIKDVNSGSLKSKEDDMQVLLEQN